MLRTGRTRGLPIREPEDNALGPCSPSSITVSAPSFKRRRGRPRKNPLQSENPALKSPAPTDHTATDSVVRKLGNKRTRSFSGDARPACLQTVCEGCGRGIYLGEISVMICYECKKDWHALCIATKGTKSLDVPGQWECCNCSRMVKLQPLQPASTDNTEAEVTLDRHARDITYETDLGDLTEDINFSQTTCTPENSRRTQDPYTLPAALPPSPKALDQSKSSERSSISLVQEDTSIITGNRNSEDPHSHHSVNRMALSENHDFRAGVINQRPEHQPSMPAEADSGSENIFRSKPSPPVLGPGCLQSAANAMHSNIVLPPITSLLPTHDAPQSSALQSPMPQHNLTASESATNHFVTGPVWLPSTFFQKGIRTLLANRDDYTEIHTPAGVIYGQDFRTLVPSVRSPLSDEIINEYLKCLTQNANARRKSDTPDSSNKIAMIGSMDLIAPGLLKSLAAFSAIYIPIKQKIKQKTYWILAALYPGSLGQRGSSEVYDSRQHWTSNIMTTSDVVKFLKFRLGDEYIPGDWTASAQQCSRPQRCDADSSLYVLANAKSIALNMELIQLESREQSICLRWQFALELVTQSIVGAF